jgi:hypothetical protein
VVAVVEAVDVGTIMVEAVVNYLQTLAELSSTHLQMR